jgi:diacylglycerol kinase (ATP)
MSGIGVVLNPYSKSYQKNPEKLDKMAFVMGDQASCHPTESLDDLREVAEDFKKRGVDVLAISGGDGTIHCTLTEFIKVYGDTPLPKLALLRGGTMNIVAGTLGIKGDAEHLLSRLLMKYHEGKAFEEKPLRLMKINDAYGCLFGMGATYRFLEKHYENPMLNTAVAIKTIIKTLSSCVVNGKSSRWLFEKFGARVSFDGGKTWPAMNYSMILSASVREVGLGFPIFHEVGESADHIHTYGMNIKPRDMLKLVPKFKKGEPFEADGVWSQGSQKIIIELDHPMPYTIDGDMLAPTDRFEVSLGPKLTALV